MDSWAIALAIYGALLASINTAILIIKARKDRPIIKVRGCVALCQDALSSVTKHFCISVSNEGKIPVKVVAVGFTLKEKGMSMTMAPDVMSAPLPRILTENDSADYYGDYDNVILKYKEHVATPTGVWARTATGRKYKGPLNFEFDGR